VTRQRVTVIDGPIPDGAFQRFNREPMPRTAAELDAVRLELLRREPIFHRPEFGCSRHAFEEMTAPTFWEVGASGRRYSREFVLDLLEERYQNSTETTWEIEDFHCQELGPDNYLATYTLHDAEQSTRRATIWRKSNGSWQIVYHQGTVVT
jgi:hypothetical protein